MSHTGKQLARKIKGLHDGTMQLTRSGFYQSIFMLRGRPLSLDHAQFWLPIIDNNRFSTNRDKSERVMVVKTSRQVYKTTFLTLISLGMSIEYDYFTTLILEPTDKQITELSNAKIQDIEGSSIITEYMYFDRKRNERQVKRRAYSTGSRIILANIYVSVLSIRGVSADATLFDEVQDLPLRNVEIVESSAQRSDFKYRAYTGTPLEEENPIEVLWDQSTQNIWVSKCTHCGYWNGPMGLKNVGLKGLICERCHGRISVDKRENDTCHWHALNPGSYMDGYSINELMIPASAPGAMSHRELLIYLENKDEQTIKNELLGLPHKGSSVPMPLKLMRSLCGKHPLVETPDDVVPRMKRYAFAGLDWAMKVERRQAGQRDAQTIKSYTTLTISHFMPAENRAYVVFIKRYYDEDTDDYNRPDNVIKDICYWLNLFNVIIVGADYGVGHKENQRIAEEIGSDRLLEFMFVGELKDKYLWDEESQHMEVARSNAFDDVVEAIKKKMFVFPRFEGYFSEYVKEFTTNYVVGKLPTRTKKYDQKGPNDTFINILYIFLVWEYYMERLDYKVKEK